MFEEDGQTGFLTVLLGLLDQIIFPSEARENIIFGKKIASERKLQAS